ncbi:recombinase family protein [Sphingomonas sp. NBWT7]|uniref:recombinase family protein n=1 Tax=Sphingomonas sp. NBWT7 TaxID=2596913 RepID=UPI001625753D|nr:recombinase family protein [Sphingomonas sp. NBWT7]QNE32435.1 recombinase family protein [Sphingomonas sp. NBWT7]
MTPVRCAIYTRKSSDEGLEQDFNSLDAQREACAAYIRSQASQGWLEIAEPYDDGGVSGGTLERPALRRLLVDVAAGHVDTIVVYKVDRLSRSLFDFAKLVEAFEQANASFVSITQALNTTSSMGRLTLNMLLSFAQFEREVTAERIRDKLAASKARGMWMGGVAPLGYKPDGRTLAIVEEHAALVRHVFDRYLALGSVRQLEAELLAQSITVPGRVTATGRAIGNVPFARSTLYLMLKRVTYAGYIAHRDKRYPGNHPAIIDLAAFERAQTLLETNKQGATRKREPRVALLAGKIFGSVGEPLIPTHTTKTRSTSSGTKVTRYYYYVSRKLHLKRSDTGVRLPAREIERLVVEEVARLFDDPVKLLGETRLSVSLNRYDDLRHRCAELAARQRQRRQDALAVVQEVRVAEGSVTIICCAEKIALLLNVGHPLSSRRMVKINRSVRLTRLGGSIRLIDDIARPVAIPDPALVRLLMRARRWWGELRQGELDITRLAQREKVSATYVTRVVRMAFLSPAVAEAILAGKQRTDVSGKNLTVVDPPAACWRAQEATLIAECLAT